VAAVAWSLCGPQAAARFFDSIDLP
jgi:hypothetical protein